MRTSLTSLALILVAATATAQIPTTPALELRPMAGALLPTGDQHKVFKDAALFGMQVAYELRPTFHLAGTFGWSPAHSKFVTGNNDVNVYQYDVGIELNAVRDLNLNWQFKPLLAVGLGGRTYDYQEGAANSTCMAGYVGIGSELQYRVAAFRVEARNYVFCYEDPIMNESKTGNEIGLTFGVAYHIRSW